MSDSGLDLVVGGSGFIGSHLCQALLDAGRRVRVLDDLTTGNRQNLRGMDVEFVQGDAADLCIAKQACQGVRGIYHLAARPSVPWSIEHPVEAHRANHETTLALIEAGAEAGAQRIVFSSSSAIYGDGPELPKTEDLSPAPLSPYAEHKLAGELALREAHRAGRIEAISLRYFNVFGPRQDPSSPYSGIISLYSKWAREGRRPSIFGDGKQTRDFVYVADVAQANILAMHAQCAQAGPVFNVATGRSVDLIELWQATCAAAEIPALEPEFLPARAGDVRDSIASLAKVEVELGFHPKIELATGLAETLKADSAQE
jgi:UDP-N-acetylglucosamine/UDP-N-acetyl-alpha-D-glucosaminouronate 4-epimerase